jgi:poly-gamma-glutamate capsule biosynthesis protein CapA/YwtB (metallophosphatase superfamily)
MGLYQMDIIPREMLMQAILDQSHRRCWVVAALLFCLLPACQSGLNVPSLTNLRKTPVVVESTAAFITQATPTVQPTATFAPIKPTASPQPIRLTVPTRWVDEAARAIDKRKQAETEWLWQLCTDAKPLDSVEQGLADIALVSEVEGVPVGRRPLALVVPFTSEWENISILEAQQILEQGSPFIAVVDWADLPYAYKALRVDGYWPSDKEYPLQQTWSLVATPGFEAAAAELAPDLASLLSNDPVVHLAAVGDVMLDRALGDAIRAGEISYPFAEVVDTLVSADLTVGNLESALGDQGAPANKGYTFRAPPAAAQTLAMAGFDLLSLANNHALDYGPTALMQGIDLLQQQGIDTVGAGANKGAAHAPHIRNSNGLMLAFLAYVHVPVEVRGFDTQTWAATTASPGIAWAEPETIQADIAALHQQADMVIVLLHSGYENVLQPSPPQVEAAHAAIDAGAQLVIGHHAHVLQGIEFYEGGVIVYGLGNFAFEGSGGPASAILNVLLDQSGVRTMEIVPVVLEGDGHPRLAAEGEIDSIRQHIYSLTTTTASP